MRKIMRSPSSLPNHAQKKDILTFLSKNKKVISFFTGKKRPIFLEKYITVQEGRRDRGTRFSYFFPSIELLKSASPEDVKRHSLDEWEVIGICPDGSLCAVHIREEIRNKDRLLFLISTFEKT